MEQLRVTVAAVGPTDNIYLPPEEADRFEGPTFEDQGQEVPYRDRLKVTVGATAAATLGEVLSQAASSFGFAPGTTPAGIAFYTPRDEEGLTWREQPWPRTVRIVDVGGAPSWAVLWSEATYTEVLAAHDAGLVEGDPLRPYFWPITPQGEDLATFAQSLWTLWQNWEHVLAAWGTYTLARRLLSRDRSTYKLALRLLNRVRTASSTLAGGYWELRLARPHDLFAYLAQSARTSAEVASLLGCSEDEAGALLWGLGFTHDGETWTLAGDEAAALLNQSVEQVRVTGRAPTPEELPAPGETDEGD